MAVNSVSSSQALASDDRKVSQKREVAKDADRQDSDKAQRAQDDNKGKQVDTRA